ncbi:MAG: flippase-like domain-containing protein [Bryobacterales bacterium]|nr:flippase-like domain-containing protein [Bryobacterales bacterium]
MSSPVAGGGRRRIPSWVGSAFVWAISVGCLLWVYHDFNWKAELPRFRDIHWAWIVIAVCADILVYVSQAWRWNMLLSPIARLPLWRTVQAIYVGLFANEVLPFRSGEIIRCYLQGVWNRIPVSLVLSSALIERLVDGLWLVLGFTAIAAMLDLPQPVEYGGYGLAVIVLALGGLVAFAVFNKRFAHHVVTRHRFSEVLRSVVEGVHVMGKSPSFGFSILASIVYLGLQLVPVYAMIRGYGVDLTIADSAVVLVVIRLSTVIPGLPGNLGLFNAAAFTALHNMLGVDSQTAKSLSAVMFFIVTVPLLIAGSIALAATGVKIKEVYASAHRHTRPRAAYHEQP